MPTSGLGYLDSSSSACSNGYTYADLYYPAPVDMTVNQIKISNADAGTNFKIGCGSLSGTTFTPRHYVTLASVPTGQSTFNAPADFTAFQMLKDDLIYLYSDNNNARPTRTANANPEGCGYVAGDKMNRSYFTIQTWASTIEVQFVGESAGWNKADIDDQDPSDIDEIDGQSLSDIDEIDGI